MNRADRHEHIELVTSLQQGVICDLTIIPLHQNITGCGLWCDNPYSFGSITYAFSLSDWRPDVWFEFCVGCNRLQFLPSLPDAMLMCLKTYLAHEVDFSLVIAVRDEVKVRQADDNIIKHILVGGDEQVPVGSIRHIRYIQELKFRAGGIRWLKAA